MSCICLNPSRRDQAMFPKCVSISIRCVLNFKGTAKHCLVCFLPLMYYGTLSALPRPLFSVGLLGGRWDFCVIAVLRGN